MERSEALAILMGEDSTGEAVPRPGMHAMSFDLLEVSGRCDPMPYVDAAYRDVIASPDKLFPHAQ